MGHAVEVGGLEYLGQLVQVAPGVNGAVHYATIVRERAIERRLLDAADEISVLARATGPVAERMDRAQQLVMGLAEQSISREPQPIGRLLPAFVDEMDRRMSSDGALNGLSTSLRDLDKKLHGLQGGSLIIVAGRPSMGKTSLALQIAEHNSLQAGQSVAVFSMEMGSQQLVEKLVSSVGRIDLENIRRGKLNREEMDRFTSVMARLAETKLVIDDTPALTVSEVRARCRGIRRRHGLGLVVVDYLQLMSAEGEHRAEEVSAISRGLKALAKELEVPVIALSQLNRGLEQRADKRPVMSDLRESGAIEQDADVIIFIYRDEVYNAATHDVGIAELIIAKQRMGPIGMVASTWLGEYGAFGDSSWVKRDDPEPPKARSARGFS
jgi:replicative DNA helicase